MTDVTDRSKNVAALTHDDAVPNGKGRIVAQLNKLLEMEISGVTRYLHYSFMVFGANRIPIVAWFREQANEGVAHSVL